MTNMRFGRLAKQLEDNQKYMMGFAWVIPVELHMFEAFPHVIMVDMVENPNNEKRSLFTVGGKDSNGKMFIFLRFFIQNQKTWMFRWIFSLVMSSLITKKLLETIHIIISDGDTHFFLQIDNAIEPYFKNAQGIHCGWHLIHKGWERHVDNASHFTNATLHEYRDIKKMLPTWVTSWMKSSS